MAEYSVCTGGECQSASANQSSAVISTRRRGWSFPRSSATSSGGSWKPLRALLAIPARTAPQQQAIIVEQQYCVLDASHLEREFACPGNPYEDRSRGLPLLYFRLRRAPFHKFLQFLLSRASRASAASGPQLPAEYKGR